MRHRRKGRTLGRCPSHQRALLRNLASALILTERDADLDDNRPKVKGRIITTLQKAKEVRPLVERCVTMARNSMEHVRAAEEFGTKASRNSPEWRSWRTSDRWRKWAQAISPVVVARVAALWSCSATSKPCGSCSRRSRRGSAIGPGGYTRIVRLAKPRLGDNGTRAVLEFVGVRDRVVERSQAPQFEGAEKPAK